jgi:L-lactate dehydrogenase complex protein LldG
VSSRALILERVRRHQPAARALPELPRFGRAVPSLAAFGRALERMGGRLVEPPPEGSLIDFIRARFPDARTLCSATPEVEGTRHLEADSDPRALVADLHDAYRDPRFRTARYAVLMTGPSATADIEGVLVRGAQGVRSLTVVPLARP